MTEPTDLDLINRMKELLFARGAPAAVVETLTAGFSESSGYAWARIDYEDRSDLIQRTGISKDDDRDFTALLLVDSLETVRKRNWRKEKTNGPA